jgi:hypothetical protein
MVSESPNAKFPGKVWDESEILNLPSYKLQNRIPQEPEYLFFFGAGASFGSDGSHLSIQGKLPPLGRDLFPALHEDPTLKYWNKLPQEIANLFQKLSFEEAMDSLDESEEWAKESFRRDLDLSRYFSRFRPLESNLYWKLARAISRKLKTRKWSGAAITLNYERLLEESFMRNSVFTVVRGITFYDDNLPRLSDEQLFEACYPHGACQFFLGQNWFTGEGNIVFGKEARALQKAGANHILKCENIPKACDMEQIPMICRYQSSKRPTVKNYFIDTQQNRCSELIANAKHIMIIGVFCSHTADRHLWQSLESTDAFITYVNSSSYSQGLFKEWASQNGKTETINYRIIPRSFKEAFHEIMEINRLL